jgi:hypothetical protein
MAGDFIRAAVGQGICRGLLAVCRRSGPTRIFQGHDMSRRQTEALVQVRRCKVESDWMEVCRCYNSRLGGLLLI